MLKDEFKFKHRLHPDTIYQAERWDGDNFVVTWPLGNLGVGYAKYGASLVEDFVKSGDWIIEDEESKPTIRFDYHTYEGVENIAVQSRPGEWLVTWGNRGNGVKNSSYYTVEQVRGFIARGEWIVRSVSVDGEGNTRALVDEFADDIDTAGWAEAKNEWPKDEVESLYSVGSYAHIAEVAEAIDLAETEDDVIHTLDRFRRDVREHAIEEFKERILEGADNLNGY